MNRKRAKALTSALLILLSLFSLASAQDQGKAVVRAILFYQPTCPHCHEVIDTHLPPLKEKYGDQFQLIGIDTSLQTGADLYQNAVAALGIPQERLGVPLMVVGDLALVGSQEIPTQLPAIIEDGLTAGGIAWPNIPGLLETFPDLADGAAGAAVDASSAPAIGIDEAPVLVTVTQTAEPAQGTLGFLIGWAVLLFSMLVVIFAGFLAWRALRQGQLRSGSPARLRGRAIPLLSVAGLGISVYLAHVEMTHVEAVCGPVGECNIVQSSQYARFLSVPVALYGVLFYLLVLGLWLLLRYQKKRHLDWIPGALAAITFAGALFSIYLTAMELLVIRAVCAWCLTSALISTLLLLIIASQWRKKNWAESVGLKPATQARWN